MSRYWDSDYLEHHGIKGQKWGNRRYQYEDGSLTPEGRQRYGVGNERRYSSNVTNVKSANQKKKGLTTKQKVAIGITAAAAIAGGVYIYKQYSNKKINPMQLDDGRARVAREIFEASKERSKKMAEMNSQKAAEREKERQQRIQKINERIEEAKRNGTYREPGTGEQKMPPQMKDFKDALLKAKSEGKSDKEAQEFASSEAKAKQVARTLGNIARQQGYTDDFVKAHSNYNNIEDYIADISRGKVIDPDFVTQMVSAANRKKS